MKHQRALTLLEVVIVTPLILFVLGASMMMIDSSANATRVHRVQARALHAAEATVDRLSLELGQTTAESGGTADAKYWLETDGIKFQRVVGVGTGLADRGQQIWSEEILFKWDKTEQVITRTIGSEAPVVIARDITDFSCVPNAEGQFICMVECTKRSRDGQPITVQRTFRATPMNRLQ